jgi:hypothetical protein
MTVALRAGYRTPMLLLTALFACVESDLGKTLVYALDQVPDPVVDRQTCATGVGLGVPLGLTQTIAFDISQDGSFALVASCALDDASSVISCATLLPEVELVLEDGVIRGVNEVHVGFEGSDCSGATLDNTWEMQVQELRLEGTVQATWRIDDTNECEDFETAIIDASGNGRGIDGCVLDFALAGTQVARCDLSAQGALVCEDP